MPCTKHLLARAAEGYRRGDVDAPRFFADVGREYIELLTGHTKKEEDILFKIAEEVLDDRTRARLREAFERAEVELGAGTHEPLERAAAELEARWAILAGERRGHPN